MSGECAYSTGEGLAAAESCACAGAGGIREYRKTQCKLLQTVRNNLKTRSPIPDWAASKVAESWNVPTSDADRNQEPGAAAASTVATPGTVAQSDKRRVVRKTHPSTIVPSRGALAEPLQGLECLMAGTKANIPLAQSWVTRRSGRNSRVPALLPIESKAQLCQPRKRQVQTLRLAGDP